MIHDLPPTPAVDREPSPPAETVATSGGRRSSADVAARHPAYRGEELHAARGPGLGCFGFQAVVLAFFLVLILVGITLDWPSEVLAALSFVALGLLLFVGQTLIFLMRLVAADRREAGRRRPLASATPTVGELADGLSGVPGTGEAPEAPGAPGTGEAPDGAATAAGTAPEAGGNDDATAVTDPPASPTAEPGPEGVRE